MSDQTCPHGEEDWYCTACHDAMVIGLAVRVSQLESTLRVLDVVFEKTFGLHSSSTARRMIAADLAAPPATPKEEKKDAYHH